MILLSPSPFTKLVMEWNGQPPHKACSPCPHHCKHEVLKVPYILSVTGSWGESWHRRDEVGTHLPKGTKWEQSYEQQKQELSQTFTCPQGHKSFLSSLGSLTNTLSRLFRKKRWLTPGMMVHTYIPGFGRLRQEGHHFEVSLCYSERSWGRRLKQTCHLGNTWNLRTNCTAKC